MTDVYNALEKLRNGNSLNANEQLIHNKALVSVLKQIHDDLDAAVFDAFGWPHDLTDEEILQCLVDLNRERAEEEARGVIRWLRPEFQNPKAFKAATQATSAAEAGSSGTGWNLRASQPAATQGKLPIAPEPEIAPTVATPATKAPWPKTLAEQAQAVRAALASQPAGMTAEQLARTFVRGQSKRVAELLETLVSLGQARALDDGRYVRV